jgi:predicted CopG family antitoxin
MVKVISLSNEAYEKLSSIKRDRSFSEVVVELVEKRKGKKKLSDFFGVWKDADTDKIKKMIKEDRKRSKLNEVRF